LEVASAIMLVLLVTVKFELYVKLARVHWVTVKLEELAILKVLVRLTVRFVALYTLSRVELSTLVFVTFHKEML